MTSKDDGQPEGLSIRLGRHWHSHEKLRFLVVGAGNTALGYLIFVGIYFLLRDRLHYLIVLILAHFLSVLCAFLSHKFLTFRAKGHFLLDFLRFNATYLGALAFGLVGLPFLVEICHIRLLFSQAILICLATLGTYLLHKRVSFRRA